MEGLYMFTHDRPIENNDDDKLNRTKFVKHIAEALLRWRDNESIVVSLNGNWGSGKTSIINLVEAYIDKHEEKNKPTIFRFNPWIFSDSGDIDKNFLYELSMALENTEGNLKVARQMRLLAKKFGTLEPETNDVSKLNTLIQILVSLGIVSFFSQFIPIELSNLSDEIRLTIFFSGLFVFVCFALIFLIRIVFETIAKRSELKVGAMHKSMIEIKHSIRTFA
jgi:hypothetical protein